MDWQPIDTAPKDGSRLRLGNEHDVNSMKLDGMCKTYGRWHADRWALSSFFVIPGGRHGLMTEVPTHWLPAPQPSGEGE